MSKRKSPYSRVKPTTFPFSIFLPTLVSFMLLTAIQVWIFGYTDITVQKAIAMTVLGIIVAAAFSLVTRYQIVIHYQQPIEELAAATQKVASGDFSVYVPPKHTTDKLDAFDVVCMDFNVMVEELGSIETLKTDFFSNVSHEIKTPLAVIQSNAEILNQDGLSPERQKEHIESILSSTRRLSDLITNMLKLNKLDKQVIKPVPEEFDICAQLCECALQFESVWESKQIEFNADLEDSAIVCADQGLLELVWTNLISNAMKFTPVGGTVTLTQATDGDFIRVSVSDTGCGMDAETRKRIFDKFYQGDTSHSTEGNGLGLALVQRILQLSDGVIQVESEPGAGSTFTVLLPINKEEETE